jgi:ribulose-bisphosphate carboxylase large chain
MERIVGTYYIETPLDPEKAAAVLAGEQSSGTFIAVPGETEELKQRFAARVEKVTLLETVATPTIPGAASSNGKYNRAEIQVSWSIENFGYNLPVLTSTLQGNLYELRQFTGLKLMDIDLPASYAKHYKGPAFGISGCRKLTNVENRPLIGTIIKPSIGLTPQQTADMVKTLVGAGIDFIKDDELLSSSANSSFNDRVDAIMKWWHLRHGKYKPCRYGGSEKDLRSAPVSHTCPSQRLGNVNASSIAGYRFQGVS